VTVRHTPRTKIVATLGPASTARDVLRGLIDAGLNVARINFSHGTHAQHAERIALVRELAEEMGRHVAVLGDLQGPRIRIGALQAPVQVDPGMDVTLVPESDPADVSADALPITYEALADDVRPATASSSTTGSSRWWCSTSAAAACTRAWCTAGR
jgi:pyruvate kinase